MGSLGVELLSLPVHAEASKSKLYCFLSERRAAAQCYERNATRGEGTRKRKNIYIYMYEQSSLVGGRGSEEDTNLSTGREVNCAFF